VLLDQYGCLHDGRQPYEGAIAAVATLADAGLSIVLLSNSSRSASGLPRVPSNPVWLGLPCWGGRLSRWPSCVGADGAIEKLAGMGFDPSHFAGAVTSGEVTHEHLSTRPTPLWQQLGSRCLHFTWGARGSVSLDGYNVTVGCVLSAFHLSAGRNIALDSPSSDEVILKQVTQDPEEADFVLAHGTEALGFGDSRDPQPCSVADMEALLRQCAGRTDRQVPLVVANPDFVTVDGAALRVMPGSLGRFYERLGGKV